MAVKKISQLNELTSVEDNDTLAIVDISATETKKVKASNIKTFAQGTLPTDISNLNNDISNLEKGWILFPTTLTFSSVDGPTGTVTTGADTTGYLGESMKIKLDQAEALNGLWNLVSNSNSQVGSFNGTDTNVTYTTGKFGNAWTGNGTSSKTVFTDNAVFKPTGAFIRSYWIKTSATGTAREIFASYSANSNIAGYFFGIDANNKLEWIQGNNTGTSSGVNYTSLSGNTTVTDGNWHFVQFVYNNNYGQIYLDGRLETNGYMITPAYATTNYVRLGCKNRTGSDESFWSGQIQDFFIMNDRVLDERAIKTIYNSGSAMSTSPLTVTKMFFINPNITTTSLGLYGGTDFILTNGAITNVYYSNVKIPYGFNLNPGKWSILSKFTGDYSVTPAVSYVSPSTSLKLNLPAGDWNNVKYIGRLYSTGNVTGLMRSCLSTSNVAGQIGVLDDTVCFYPGNNAMGVTGSSKLHLTIPTSIYIKIACAYTSSSTTLGIKGTEEADYGMAIIISATSNYL